jgi:hypothetical protein
MAEYTKDDVKRWNYERRGGVLVVCKNEHEAGAPCDYRPATEEEARLVAEASAEMILLPPWRSVHERPPLNETCLFVVQPVVGKDGEYHYCLGSWGTHVSAPDTPRWYMTFVAACYPRAWMPIPQLFVEEEGGHGFD